MLEIASDRPLFKTILVEMVYSVIHLHNRVNKSRIVVQICRIGLYEVLDFRCFPPFFSAKDGLPWWSKMQRKWEKRAACNFWTLRLTVPNSPIIYNLSNFITGCWSLGDKIIEVLLYLKDHTQWMKKSGKGKQEWGKASRNASICLWKLKVLIKICFMSKMIL